MHSVLPSSGARLPSSQSAHSAAPNTALNVPGAQSTHSVRPVLPAKEPGAQSWQLTAPSAFEKVPCAHGKQEVLPDWALYVPRPQGAHGSRPVALNVPGWQRAGTQISEPGSEVKPSGHFRQTMLPAGAKNPASQRSQLNAPGVFDAVPGEHCVHSRLAVEDAYVPGGQFLHGSVPFAPNVPAAQREAVHSLDPASDSYPALHFLHFDAPGSENSPAAHRVQVVAPLSLEAVPALHSKHLVAPDSDM